MSCFIAFKVIGTLSDACAVRELGEAKPPLHPEEALRPLLDEDEHRDLGERGALPSLDELAKYTLNELEYSDAFFSFDRISWNKFSTESCLHPLGRCTRRWMDTPFSLVCGKR